MATLVTPDVFYRAAREKEEGEAGFLEGLLQGARGTAADVVGGLGWLATLGGSPERKAAASDIYDIIKGEEKPLSSLGKLGSILGSFGVSAPLLAAPEILLARVLGAGRLGTALAGGTIGALIGGALGDPAADATSRAVNAGLFGTIGSAFGAILPIKAKGAAAPAKAIEEATVATPATAKILDGAVENFAAKTLVGALSGGIIGGVWLEDDPHVLFSPAGAAAGAAIAGLGAAKGKMLADKVRQWWDVGEMKALRGLGPVIKPLAREAEQERNALASEVATLFKVAKEIPKPERENIGKAIEGFMSAMELDPKAISFGRQLVETTHRLYKRFVELGAIDPERTPPEKFLERVSNPADVVKGYLPRVYSREAAEEATLNLTDDMKKMQSKLSRLAGSATHERGIMVPLRNLIEKVGAAAGIEAKDFSVGDTFFDGKHNWTVLKDPFKRRGLMAWRDYTLEEQEAMGRQWDILLGLAKLGQEHSKLLANSALFKKIADDPALATREARKASKMGWIRVDDTVLPGGFKAHGALNGAWVRPDVAEALQNYKSIMKPIGGPVVDTLRGINQFYKKAFLGTNEASYKNAFVGNLVLSYLHGYNPFEVLASGAVALRDKAFLNRLVRYGIGIGAGHGMDIDPGLFRAVVDEPFVSGVGRLMRNVADKVHVAADKAIQFYSSIDKVFKAGLVRKLVNEGIPESAAVAEANKVFVSSELLPATVGALRDTVTPFISFYYRFLENTLPEVVSNPHRLLAIMALVDAFQMAGYIDTYGPEKWRKGKKYEQAVAPDWRKMKPGGIFADYVRTPWGFFSTSFMPTNLPISMASNDQLPTAVAAFLQNPILTFAYNLVTGRDPSTDAPLSKIEAAVKTLPSPLPRKAYSLLAQKGYLPDPLVLWFNTTGSHPDRSPIEAWEVIWDAFLPTYSKVAPEYDYSRAVARIKTSIQDEIRVRQSKARRATSEEYREAQFERVSDLQQKRTKEINRLTELRQLATEVR